MHDLFFFRLPSRVARGRQQRPRLFRVLPAAALFFAVSVYAQVGALPTTQVHDTSALKPPPGSRVAIIEFADMECPYCAQVNPLLEQAVAKYKIPWVRHDYIIPSHAWSPRAAANARWFDTESKALGDAYRDAVSAKQPFIYNLMTLSLFTQEFAQSHGVKLPYSLDPQDKFSADVQADTDLGKRIGITHTPTIFIVTANSKGAPYTEVLDPEHDLNRAIGQALADTRH